MTNKKLILFDVDHTLMDVGDSHKKVFASAFKKVLNVYVDYKNWEFHGVSDLFIIQEIMDRNGIKKDPKKIQKIIEVMIKDFERENLGHAVLLSGVNEILNKLGKDKQMIIGLVTGNLEKIAYMKLKHFKIEEFFILGGFGDISTIRSDLVKFAVKKAEFFHGKIDKKDVFIIGDTIHDIKAAKDAGVKVIAVATGAYPKEQLSKLKPDYLVDNLKDTEKIIDVIKNG
jgi:phosphoglycolate phosphatase